MKTTSTTAGEEWDLVIRPQARWYDLRLKQVARYRDLLMILVKRDFVAVYKQTLLGPLWFLIQPVLTALTFTFIFGSVAKISTDGSPRLLFYMGGITLWAYFSDCLTKTSNTFIANARIFGKVYFPRLIIPLSVIVSNLIKFGIQLVIFLCVWSYYYATTEKVNPHWELLWVLPLLIFLMAGLGFASGILISSLTTKYRDLNFLVAFGVQLLMYGSSVVLPISTMSEKVRSLLLLNPVTSVIEAFKYIFLGSGSFLPVYLVYSAGFMLVLMFLAVVIFTKVEKSFMDTV